MVNINHSINNTLLCIANCQINFPNQIKASTNVDPFQFQKFHNNLFNLYFFQLIHMYYLFNYNTI